MTAKEYLSQAIVARDMIRRSEEQIRELHLRMESAGAVRYDKPNIMSSPSNDALANYMSQLTSAEAKSRELQSAYYNIYNTIQEQIGQVRSPYSKILALRYLDDIDLRRIGIILSYSYDHVKHLHGNALRVFSRQFLES